ncbi:hypothetical protein AXX17_AT1G29260 [Arabidopsis thaliana]|uniref:Uncharacterized protein n=1 Tax=Arabidopsis thaliana TaxID=3702 RepID=A0A178WDU7_ARATH|nr:hypothetical protein AXX17_AT1G29260 [Arabidopsis thaliana]
MGAFRESNSGPLAPKARIIPLDQMPCCICIMVQTFFSMLVYAFKITVSLDSILTSDA